MSKECAFCPNVADKSGEHIWSDWMDKLFRFKKRFVHTHPIERIRTSTKLDWTVKVICKNCNSTWMSDIESKYAKPIMSRMILGETGFEVNQSHADAIGLFAFKTAVVLDHLARSRQPFFPRSIRHGFGASHAVPGNVQMWLAGFAVFESGNVITRYHEGKLPSGYGVEFYVCTYSVGHLAFQVVALKNFLDPNEVVIRPRNARFEFLAVPFWPWIQAGVVWPLPNVLRSTAEFKLFAARWNDVFARPVSR